jgi:hypothetical protein
MLLLLDPSTEVQLMEDDERWRGVLKVNVREERVI